MDENGVPADVQVELIRDPEVDSTMSVNLYPCQQEAFDQPSDIDLGEGPEPPAPSLFDDPTTLSKSADIYGSDELWPPELVKVTPNRFHCVKSILPTPVRSLWARGLPAVYLYGYPTSV